MTQEGTTEALEPIFRVVEEINGLLETELTAGPYHGKETWNNKHRIYPRIQEARVYKKKLAKQGRKAKILKFVYEGEVE